MHLIYCLLGGSLLAISDHTLPHCGIINVIQIGRYNRCMFTSNQSCDICRILLLQRVQISERLIGLLPLTFLLLLCLKHMVALLLDLLLFKLLLLDYVRIVVQCLIKFQLLHLLSVLYLLVLWNAVLAQFLAKDIVICKGARFFVAGSSYRLESLGNLTCLRSCGLAWSLQTWTLNERLHRWKCSHTC